MRIQRTLKALKIKSGTFSFDVIREMLGHKQQVLSSSSSNFGKLHKID